MCNDSFQTVLVTIFIAEKLPYTIIPITTFTMSTIIR